MLSLILGGEAIRMKVESRHPPVEEQRCLGFEEYVSFPATSTLAISVRSRGCWRSSLTGRQERNCVSSGEVDGSAVVLRGAEIALAVPARPFLWPCGKLIVQRELLRARPAWQFEGDVLSLPSSLAHIRAWLHGIRHWRRPQTQAGSEKGSAFMAALVLQMHVL